MTWVAPRLRSEICTGRGVVALCGRSGSGKSTLAGALTRRGFIATADDALPFEATPEGVAALPLPFRLRLQPSSAEALDLPEPGTTGDAGDMPRPLAAFILLDPQPPEPRDPDSPTVLLPVSPSDAFGALMPQAYCFSLEDGKERLVSAYLELVRRVPAFSLSYVQELVRLDEITGVIEAAWGS